MLQCFDFIYLGSGAKCIISFKCMLSGLIVFFLIYFCCKFASFCHDAEYVRSLLSSKNEMKTTVNELTAFCPLYGKNLTKKGNKILNSFGH